MSSRQKRRYADLSKPKHRWDLRVEIPEEGMRLDLFVTKRCSWRSRSEIQRAIDEGKVTVDGAVRKSSTRLLAKQTVSLDLELPDEIPDPSAIPLDVISDDGVLLVLNKQPGIIVHPVGRNQLANLLAALHARFRSDDASKDRVPHLCHRIDKDTSGVFLVAMREDWKADVSIQFERREVKKEYLALVHGVPPAEGAIDEPLLYERDAWPRVRVDAAGLPSRTTWRVEEAFADAALVRFRPETGRMHQIRVHAAHHGHPLVNDASYGGRGPVGPSDAPVLARCALHAERLTVRHPVSGERITFTAPLAPDIAAACDRLRVHPLGHAPGEPRRGPPPAGAAADGESED
ncbi:MAG: Ribosomal large subunit pseudouridine synthase D [Planctomycetes bacterium]|nr:Ribosomal large subunit pseudouridine synthase D [Planctomycetota bacterium]